MMDNLDTLLKKPLVPVFYHADLEVCKMVLEACFKGGVRVFEFTNRGENALAVFKDLAKYSKTNYPELKLGIGTIFDADSALEFISSGADFVVQPFTTASVGKICKQHNTPWIPGAMTLTEIQNAQLLGAEVVKIFPGNVLGSQFIKALRGPMPKVKLMVTGGVEPTIQSIDEWFSAGVNAVGLGSQLFKDISKPDKISTTLNTLFEHLNLK